MRIYKDDQLISDSNSIFEIAAIAVLGDREDQQDSFGFDLKSDEGVVIVCDGMGGYEGGKLASEVAVDCILKEYQDGYPCDNHIRMLTEATKKANDKICTLKSRNGKPLNAGSTIVTVLINRNGLCWCSVGDSRAYLLRDGEFVQLTQDHNYLTVLNEKLNSGMISESEFYIERSKGEALISFLGVGELKLVDCNVHPVELKSGDKIIVMSDGLYKIVSDEEISRIIDNFSNTGEAVMALEMKAKKNAKSKGAVRDNMTVAIMKIK